MVQRFYHYTSIETLFKIINSKKLRFRNLTEMDDPDETQSLEFKNIGKWNFISSWTSLRDELVMFQSYGGLDGVCISLPELPFYTENIVPFEDNPKFDKDNNMILFEKLKLTTGFNYYTNKYNVLFYPNEVQKLDIEYTNEKEKLYPKIITYNGSQYVFSGTKMGKYKDRQWSFQKEVRYTIQVTPFYPELLLKLNPEDPGSAFISGKIEYNPPFSVIDIPVSLEGMEVVFGPKVPDYEYKMSSKEIYDLVPNVKISKSNIRVR